MTNEEAKAYFEMRLKDKYKYAKGYTTQREAFEMAVEALQKQIPKKPIVAEMEWLSQPVECKCPACGEYVCKYDAWARATLREHHCKCGQAIDWEGCTRE